MRAGLLNRFIFILIGVAVILILVAIRFNRVQADAHQRMSLLAKSTMQENANRILQQRGEASAHILNEALINPLYFYDLNAIGTQIRHVLNDEDVAFVVVFDADGLMVHDGSREVKTYGRRIEIATGFELGSVTIWHPDRIEVTQPIKIGEQLIGGVRIGIKRASTEALIDRAQSDYLNDAKQISTWIEKRLWFFIISLIFLAGVIAYLVARNLVVPIRRIADVARQIEQLDYSNRFNSRRGDEIGDLMRGIDRMSNSIATHDREIRRMAYADALTGMHNRAFLNEALERAITSAKNNAYELGLLFVDLDDFKRINDTLGHQVGDLALTQMAERLNLCLDDLAIRHPEIDIDLPLISRFGGDEFVALVAAKDARALARELAEVMLDAIRLPINLEGQTLHMCGSIGVTVYPDDGLEATALLKNGDIAMYQAKVHGKNCYRFYTTHLARIANDRLSMEQDLRVAIDAGIIDVCFQPITELRTGKVIGAEALARWDHAERGSVAPTEFIALAEDTGLIAELGIQILSKACIAAAIWNENVGEGPFVSVNVSAKQLRHAKFPLQLARILHQSKLPPSRLHLELTESTLLDAAPLALAVLGDLHQMGVKLWLDDFGTGFSGLNHLRKVPVDGLKIDKSFVADLPHDHYDLALTSAIIAMARSLNITVVAEGIETKAQYDVLRSMHCDMGQGFALSQPLTIEQMRELIFSKLNLNVAA